MCPSIYVQVVDIAAFCLTEFKHFYSIFMGLSFDIHTKEYTPSKWTYCLVDGELFFWCVDVLKFTTESESFTISLILSVPLNIFCEVFSELKLGPGFSNLLVALQTSTDDSQTSLIL